MMTMKNNIVIIGGGIQGTSVAYYLAERLFSKSGSNNNKITILEAVHPASAASGKGGGFMARSWGDGSPTQALHEQGFDLYEQLATQLKVQSYRKIPVLSVTPASSASNNRHNSGIELAKKNKDLADMLPNWLDGNHVGRISPLGYGEDTAQVTPKEFVECMLEKHKDNIQVVIGTCTGIQTDPSTLQSADSKSTRKVTGVTYTTTTTSSDGATLSEQESILLPADAVIVAAGPWSCAAEDWFHGAVKLPMEGVKSTSIVWKTPDNNNNRDDPVQVDATALFCGENHRYGTHLEVYPRPDGTVYICGIGGSDYITTSQLKQGAFRDVCEANESRVAAAKSSFEEISSFYEQNGELERVQACMRPCPPDAMPYMGPIPGYEGAYINAGHNCWGIAWAPACGRAIAELVLDGESTSIDLSPFDPSRFTPESGRGGRGRKKQGTSVGEQW